MKRLTVLHTEWSNGWGGQEMRIVSEARGVAARGHRVLIAAREECRILERARAAGLETRTLSMRSGFDLRGIAGLARLIRREHVDLVNTHSSVDSWIGAFAASLTGAVLVRTRHVSNPISPHLLNFVHRMPRAIIATGDAVRRQLIEHTGLLADAVVSVPTGVDTDYFSPRPCNRSDIEALGIPASARIVAKVAALRRFKRHEVLVEAAARLLHRSDLRSLDLHFLLIGAGGLRSQIEERIEQLGLTPHFRLLGHVEDVRPFLSCTDVVVLSSGSHEGVPQSLTQALAMARPVVATDVGSVAELVQNERTGLLVPPNQPEALADGIERFLLDAPLARACGLQGRAHVLEHYSFDRMIDGVLEVYQRVLA